MSLSNALSYLTVLPIPFKKHIPLNRSVHFFPLIGAAMGSILVLALLTFKLILPQVLACMAAVALWESMTGGIHLRAFAELMDGRRTFPGSGFGPKPRYKWQGITAVTVLLLVKIGAMAYTRADWQPFAVLLAPIMGRGSQALGIIFSRHRVEVKGPVDPAVKRRRIRALVFISILLISICLFPWKAAAIMLAQYGLVMVAGYRILNAKMEGLTVQTLGSVAELSEAGFLTACAVLSYFSNRLI